MASVIFSKIEHEAILATAMVFVSKLNQNRRINSRVLLDSGSQVNIILAALVKRLNLPIRKESQSIIIVGNQSNDSDYRVELVIASKYSNLTLTISCIVMYEIVSLVPHSYIPIDNWNIPNQLQLADPTFNCPASVDLLLGSRIFWSVLKSEQYRLGNNLPKLCETELGWIIADDLKSSRHQTSVSVVSVVQ